MYPCSVAEGNFKYRHWFFSSLLPLEETHGLAWILLNQEFFIQMLTEVGRVVLEKGVKSIVFQI